MVHDDAYPEDPPQLLVDGAPARALDDERKTNRHQLAHDDAECANPPLVELAVHQQKGAADVKLKVVEICMTEDGYQLLNLFGGGLKVGQRVVHHLTAEAAGPSQKGCGGLQDRRGVERRLGFVVTPLVVCSDEGSAHLIFDLKVGLEIGERVEYRRAFDIELTLQVHILEDASKHARIPAVQSPNDRLALLECVSQLTLLKGKEPSLIEMKLGKEPSRFARREACTSPSILTCPPEWSGELSSGSPCTR